jgi:hypothetical protein
MTDPSTIVVPALLAGSVAIAVTVAIERLGGRVGGFLGTLPTTIVPSSLGMFAAEPEVFRDALCIAPAGMLVNALFLYGWRVLPDRLPTLSLPAMLAVMITLTLTGWAAAATGVVTLTQALTARGVPPDWIGLAATATILAIGVAACWSSVPTPKGNRRVGPLALLSRGILAAGAIGLAIAIARTGQGNLAGVASVFPAIFLTSMVTVWWSQGRAVSGGAVGPMMLGSASVAAYALVAAWAMPAIGPALGATLAWCVAAFGVTAPATVWLGRRQAARTA